MKLHEALNLYDFVWQDVAEGLNYEVKLETANLALQAIDKNAKLFTDSPSAQEFLEEFYKLYKERG